MQTDPTSRYRKYERLECFVNGQRYLLDSLPERRVGIDGGRSSATVPLRDLLPESAAGTPLQVAYSINGARRVLYTGIVAKRSYGVAGVGRTVQATDILSRLEKSIKEGCAGADGLLFDNTPWVTAVTNVLNRAGIADSEIANIEDPSGGVMTVGAVEAICHTPDENLGSIFAELLKMNGATAFVLPASGKAKVVALSRTPPANPSLIYSNRDSGAYRWNRVGHVLMGVEDVVNRMTATGGMVTGGVQVVQTWVATGIEGRADSISCDYWQQQAQVDWASEFYGRLHCREERVFEVAAPVDLDVLCGMSCQIDAPLAGLDHQPALIVSADVRGTEMVLTCSLGPSEIDGYTQGLLPVADFSIFVAAERVLISGQPQTIYDVYCDATSSFDPDGEIISYQWNVAGATPLNTPSQSAQTTIVLDTLAGVEITLTVTDDNDPGNTDSLTRDTDAPGVQVWTRILSTACGSNGWRILVDQSGWRSFIRNQRGCEAVPRFNDQGPLLSLWDDSQVWRWDDYDGDPIHIGTLPTDTSHKTIAITEGMPDYVVAGDGPHLYRSVDGGTTWKHVATFSAIIWAIETGYQDPTYIRVCAGNEVQHSYNGGLSWEAIAAVANASAARAMASAPWGHLGVFEGGTTNADALRFDEGHTVDWSGVATPPMALRGATPLLTEAGYIVVEPEPDNRLYLLTEAAPGAFVASEIDYTGPSLVDLLRDGLLPDVVYATAAKTSKLLSKTLSYEIDTAQSQQIGYGALYVAPQPPVAARLIVSAEKAVWEGLSNPATGVFSALTTNTWQELSADPFDICDMGYGPGVFYVLKNGDDTIFDRYAYAAGAWTHTASFYSIPADENGYWFVRLARTADRMDALRTRGAIGARVVEMVSWANWSSGAPTLTTVDLAGVVDRKYGGTTIAASGMTTDDEIVIGTRQDWGASHRMSLFTWNGSAVSGAIVGTDSEPKQIPYDYGAAWSGNADTQAIIKYQGNETQTKYADGATLVDTTLHGQHVVGVFQSETHADAVYMAAGTNVYRVASRGAGTQQVVFIAPYDIAHFMATHHNGIDLLVVAVDDGSNVDFYTSTDSGATWALTASLEKASSFSLRSMLLLPEV